MNEAINKLIGPSRSSFFRGAATALTATAVVIAGIIADRLWDYRTPPQALIARGPSVVVFTKKNVKACKDKFKAGDFHLDSVGYKYSTAEGLVCTELDDKLAQTPGWYFGVAGPDGFTSTRDLDARAYEKPEGKIYGVVGVGDITIGVNQNGKAIAWIDDHHPDIQHSGTEGLPREYNYAVAVLNYARAGTTAAAKP